MATRPDEAKVWRDPVLSLSSARPCGREWHKLPTKIFNFCSIKNNREHNRKRRSGKWKIVTIFLCSLSSSLYQTIFQISSIDCVLINSQWLTKDALLLDYLVCCPIIVYCRLLLLMYAQQQRRFSPSADPNTNGACCICPGNASITAAAPSLQGKQVFCGEDEYVWRVFKVIIREGGVRTLSFGHFGNFWASGFF